MTDRFEQFTVSVSRIYQCIQKIQRQEMANYGLKSAHVACLLTLWQHPGITATELGKLCEKDKAAVSRTVTELEQIGMISRGEDTGAYRAPLHLTETGLDVAEKVKRRTQLAVDKAGSGLTDEDRKIMYAALDRIAGNLHIICRDGLKNSYSEENE